MKWASSRPRTLRARPRILLPLQPDANNRQNSSAQSSGTVLHGSACPNSSAEQAEGTSLVTGRQCSTLQPVQGGTAQQHLPSEEQDEQLAGQQCSPFLLYLLGPEDVQVGHSMRWSIQVPQGLCYQWVRSQPCSSPLTRRAYCSLYQHTQPACKRGVRSTL